MNKTNKNNPASLSAEEREVLKRQFVSFMDANPIATPRIIMVRSPYFPTLLRAPAFALAFLLVVGGTAYAAENSLPGNTLYSIKLNVTEPIQVALAFTPEKKASVENRMVSRRLDEIAEVTSTGKQLDPGALEDVRLSLAAHIDAVQSAIQVLKEHGDTGAALQANGDLAATLDASSEILGSITDASVVNMEDIHNVIGDVQKEVDAAQDVNTSLESAVASSTDTSDIQEAAKESRSDIEDSIAELRSLVANPSSTIDAQDLETISEGIAKAEKNIEKFTGIEESGDIKTALLGYEDINLEISTLQAIVKADQALTVDVVGTDSE